MASKHYIWKGPPTSVEVWSEPHSPDVALIFSGQVAPGREIAAELPDGHSMVASWLAFKLIEEKPLAPPRQKAGAAENKEKADG